MDATSQSYSMGGPILLPRIDQSQNYFTVDTKAAIRIVAAVSSSLSLAAILITFAFFWFIPKKLLRHKLIMLTIFGSFVRAAWYFVFSMVVISGVDVATPSAFCQATGFFLNVGNQITDVSILLMAVHGALRVFRPRIGSGGRRDWLERHQYWVYAITLLLPPAVTALAFINDDEAFTAQGPFCFLPNRPIWPRLTLSWALRYVVCIVILVLSTAVYLHVGFEFRKYDRTERELSYGQRMGSRDSGLSGSDWEEEPATPGSPLKSTVLGPATPEKTQQSSAWWSRRPSQLKMTLPEETQELRLGVLPSPSPMRAPSEFTSPTIRRPSIASVLQEEGRSAPARRPSAVSFASHNSLKVPPMTTSSPTPRTPSPNRKRASLRRPRLTPIRVDHELRIEESTVAASPSRDPFTHYDIFGKGTIDSPPQSPTSTLRPPMSHIPSTQALFAGSYYNNNTLRPPLSNIPSSQTLFTGSYYNSPLPTPTIDSPRSSLTLSRHRLRRQLRLIFIYPILYIVMWFIPFISYVLTYTDRFGMSPPPVLQALATFSVTVMGMVDCGVFVWRERLWVGVRNRGRREGRRASVGKRRGCV